jgi:hypothetical protein
VPAVPKRRGLAPQDGLHPGLGGRELPERLLPGAAAVAARLVLDGRDIDRRQSAGAHAPGQLGRLASRGVDAVARLLRDQRGGHDPAEPLLLREITSKPGPAGSRFVDQDTRCRVRGARADALVKVALAGPETPQADDCCLLASLTSATARASW